MAATHVVFPIAERGFLGGLAFTLVLPNFHEVFFSFTKDTLNLLGPYLLQYCRQKFISLFFPINLASLLEKQSFKSFLSSYISPYNSNIKFAYIQGLLTDIAPNPSR